MQISIASGKGGTGKTSLAVSLFLANSDRARLLDCDVEEPNCHLFISSEAVSTEAVVAAIPIIDKELCTLCGKCVEACQFNALAIAGKAGVLVFDELCHSCGGCALVCPSGAIQEKWVHIGEVKQSEVMHHEVRYQELNHDEVENSGGEKQAEFSQGTLVVGHASTPTVIKSVKKLPPLFDVEYTLVDSPPGTACAFAAAVEDSDFVLLVTEATPFGLHDLTLAIEALQKMNIAFAVIINRILEDENIVSQYCTDHGFPIFLQIPESRHVAETYARGGTLLDVMPELYQPLRDLLERCRL